MIEIVKPFLVTYGGRDTDQHAIDGEAFGESVIGTAKFYTSIAHYVTYGFVPRRNYRKDFRAFALATAPGSVDQWWFVAPAIANEYAIHAELYKTATSLVFGKIVDAVKKRWTQPKETVRVVETLANALVEQSKINAEVQTVLANGLVKSNENITHLMERLIETIPEIAEATRPNGRMMVAPVGASCTNIIQFAKTEDATTITEEDADVIRGDDAMEVDDMAAYTLNRISEINVRTGHCLVDIEGTGAGIPGKITDPVLSAANNPYTLALAQHSALSVQAKAVRKGGSIQRLYISNSVRES